MAKDCRQPRVDKDKRKCFLCDMPGHVARDCKERRAPIKAVQQSVGASPPFFGCVQIADADGFVAVRRGVRQQEPNFGDFIRTTVRKTSSGNRFRELTVGDLLEIDPEITSRGGGHLLLTRQVEAKFEVFSIRVPRAQFERPGADWQSARSSFALFVACLHRNKLFCGCIHVRISIGLFIGTPQMCRSRRWKEADFCRIGTTRFCRSRR